MRLLYYTLGGLLCAAQAHSAAADHLFKRVFDAAQDLHARNQDIETRMRYHAQDMVDDIERRAAATTSTVLSSATPQATNTPTTTLAQWDADTEAACETALAALNGQASNPAGLAICYNLPFLDNRTGVFQAEVRMYNISAPTDDWVGLTVGDMGMTLSYPGATVQMTNSSSFPVTKRDGHGVLWTRLRDDERLRTRQAAAAADGTTTGPLKTVMYVGKINADLMESSMTDAQLQPLLIPTINLIASNPSTLHTTLSSTEAAFVHGVFAKQATTTAALATTSTSTSSAVATNPPLVVPGTRLAFFPTGLVITCIWTAGLGIAVGVGTVGRVQFREQYRRRVRREEAVGVRTI